MQNEKSLPDIVRQRLFVCRLKATALPSSSKGVAIPTAALAAGGGLLGLLVGQRRLDLFTYGDGEFHGGTLTVDGHGQRVADGGFAYQTDEVAAAGDLRAVDPGDDVTRLKSGLGGGGAVGNGLNGRASGDAVELGLLVHVGNADAHIRAWRCSPFQ